MLSILVVYLLLASLLIDIGGGLGVKYVAVMLAVIVSFYKVIIHGVSRQWAVEALLVLYLLVMGGVSIAGGASLGHVYEGLSFLVFFLLLALLRGLRPSQICRAFVRTAIVGAVVVVAVFVFFYVNPSVGHPVGDALTGYRMGYLGYKQGFAGLPNVYFRWSAWLVLGLALLLSLRAFLSALIVAAAALFTISTAIISVASVVLVGYMFAIERRLRGVLLIVLLVAAALCVVFIGYMFFGAELVAFVMSKFSSGSASTSVKLGHIASVLHELHQNWWVAVFGQGVGSSFYSVGVGNEVRNIEVSQFNVLRQYGLVGAFIIFAYIAFVVVQVSRCGKVGKAWSLGLVGMFFVAATNPVLMSPVFFVPLIMARVYALECMKGPCNGD